MEIAISIIGGGASPTVSCGECSRVRTTSGIYVLVLGLIHLSDISNIAHRLGYI